MRRYVTVDVFTDRRYAGNPLAVVLDAEGLSDDQMQAIATEFNYSETTFVLPPADRAHSARVRIYTPTTEVPFAGHPNVGTAVVLAREWVAAGQALPERFVFEEAAGLVPVALWQHGAEVTGAELTAPAPLACTATVTAAEAAECLALSPDEVVVTTHAPTVASVGLAFLIVEVASREALARSHGDLAVHQRVLKPVHAEGVYAYVRAKGQTDLDARMFAPLDKVPEDPATGSATVAALALLATLASTAVPAPGPAAPPERRSRR